MSATCECGLFAIIGEEFCVECFQTKGKNMKLKKKKKDRLYTICQTEGCYHTLSNNDEKWTGECDTCWGKKGETKSPTHKEPAVKCSHESNPIIYTLDKGLVRAGGIRDEEDWDLSSIDLILDLTGMGGSSPVSMDKRAEAITKKYGVVLDGSIGTVPRIVLSWKDGAAPPVTMEYFEEVAKLVRKGCNIMVNCFGGHGRTGTALLAIGYTAGQLPKDLDPVAWLRKIYCAKAVETQSQINWLNNNNINTQEKPTNAQAFKGFRSQAKGQQAHHWGWE